MTLNLTSRRTVAGRFALLAVVPLATAALCLVSALAPTPALAQHGGAGGAHTMGTGSPAGMMAPRGLAPNPAAPGNPGHFDRPAVDVHGQPRMGLQLGLTGRWWDDHGTSKKLNLSSDQQRRMDTVFETNWPTITNLYTNLQREQIGLANLSRADLQDETKVFAAIDRVSQARTNLEKEYAHTFLQIRQQLDPQQLDALDRQIANSH